MNNNTIDFLNFQNKFKLVSISLLTIIALIGNSLVVYVLTREEFHKIPLFRLLTVSTVFDTLSLLNVWPGSFNELFGISSSNFKCKIFAYLVYVPGQISSWIIVYTGIDCLISVKFPRKFEFRNTIKFQLLLVINILIFMLLIDIPYIYTKEVLLIQNETKCVVNNFNIAFYINLTSASILTLFPNLISILNSFIIFKQLTSRKAKLQNRIKLAKETKLFKVYISISIFYLITNLPYCILVIISNLLNVSLNGTLIWNVFLLIAVIYPAFDFFTLYFSNHLFRSYIKSIIKCKLNH